MKDHICPLCHGSDITQKEFIEFETLKEAYYDIYHIEISDLSSVPGIYLEVCCECKLEFFLPTISGSESFYDEIQANDWYYLEDKAEFSVARRYVTASDSILEVGCGSGYFGKSLQCKDYTGLELSSSAIEKSKFFGLNIIKQFVQEYSNEHPEKHDIVCSFQVLEHIEDLRAFLGSSLKCLKTGGLFIVSVPNNDSFLKYELNGFLNMPPHHLTRWSEESLKNLGRIFNLCVVEIKNDVLDPVHYQAYYQASIHKNFLELLKKDKRVVYKLLLNPQIRFLLSIFTRILSPFLQFQLKNRAGHSITAIYRKTDN